MDKTANADVLPSSIKEFIPQISDDMLKGIPKLDQEYGLLEAKTGSKFTLNNLDYQLDE